VSISLRSSIGLPVGVQLLAAPFDETNALLAAGELERRIGFQADQEVLAATNDIESCQNHGSSRG
jgi:Asp-tRNA(Asn)/Glu-tRNA(Gln) amidotransferase A subunit family amidase